MMEATVETSSTVSERWLDGLWSEEGRGTTFSNFIFLGFSFLFLVERESLTKKFSFSFNAPRENE